MLIIFAATVGTAGYFRFTDSLTEEYNDSAFRSADTAVTLINADNIENYLKPENIEPITVYYTDGEEAFAAYAAENGITGERLEDLTSLAAEYTLTLKRMNVLREKQNVTILYAIAVDTTDYENFVSIFNCVDPERYTPWDLGTPRYTTKTDQNTYQTIYKNIYENGLKRDKIVRTTNLRGLEPHITSLIPINDSDGKVVAIMCVQRPMSELNSGRTRYLVFVLIIMVAMIAASILLFSLIMRGQVVMPLQKIVNEAGRFAEQNSAPEKPLTEKISRVNEIADLAVSVDEMETATLKYIDNLSEAIAEKHRVGAELQLASTIQEGTIPTDYPKHDKFSLYATMRTAKEVGGDFYDFFFIDDDHVALVIADVSGKGVPAALFMMVTKIILKERALMGGEPADIMDFVNDRICANNRAEMFVTIWFGVLELSTGHVVSVNAGHDYPAVQRKGGKYEFIKGKNGPVVGAIPGIKYKQSEFYLNSGDKLFVYTDGIPEATDTDKRMLTLDGMLSLLNSYDDIDPKTIIENLFKDVDAFVKGADQFDDMTTLCVNYHPEDENAKLVVDATDENLEKAMNFLSGYLEEKGCSPKLIMNMSIAFEEIFVNVAHYAYRPNVGEVEILLRLADNVLFLTFIDGGRPYDPTAKVDPDVTLSADERDVGGLGIYMAKKLVDNMTYNYVNGKNVLVLEKKL